MKRLTYIYLGLLAVVKVLALTLLDALTLPDTIPPTMILSLCRYSSLPTMILSLCHPQGKRYPVHELKRLTFITPSCPLSHHPLCRIISLCRIFFHIVPTMIFSPCVDALHDDDLPIIPAHRKEEEEKQENLIPHSSYDVPAPKPKQNSLLPSPLTSISQPPIR